MRQAFAASFLLDEHDATLASNERMVLLYMASTAYDGDQPPRYWGGREALARYALGRVVPDDDAAHQKARKSIFESVRQALDGLVSRGLIERIGTAHPGRSQEYAITLSRVLAPQADIGSSARTAWVIGKDSLRKAQAHIGPETKHTQTNKETTDYVVRAPYVRPVDRREPIDVAV